MENIHFHNRYNITFYLYSYRYMLISQYYKHIDLYFVNFIFKYYIIIGAVCCIKNTAITKFYIPTFRKLTVYCFL